MEEEWECEHCLLVHRHRRDLEDVRSLDFIDRETVLDMKWNPECNCGKYELLQMHEAGHIELPEDSLGYFKSASVPYERQEEIEKEWGTYNE